MSRLAKRPVLIPSGVDIQMKGNTISFKGPKGTISREFPQGLSIEKNESQLMISMASDELEKPLLGPKTQTNNAQSTVPLVLIISLVLHFGSISNTGRTIEA